MWLAAVLRPFPTIKEPKVHPAAVGTSVTLRCQPPSSQPPAIIHWASVTPQHTWESAIPVHTLVSVTPQHSWECHTSTHLGVSYTSAHVGVSHLHTLGSQSYHDTPGVSHLYTPWRQSHLSIARQRSSNQRTGSPSTTKVRHRRRRRKKNKSFTAV